MTISVEDALLLCKGCVITGNKECREAAFALINKLNKKKKRITLNQEQKNDDTRTK